MPSCRWIVFDFMNPNLLVLTLIYLGYFDNLFYMGGGGGKKWPRSNSGI